MSSRVTLAALAIGFVGGAVCSLALVRAYDNPQPAKPDAGSMKRTEVLSQELPRAEFRKLSAATIDFAPGAAATKHRHDVAVLGYVLQGSVESQLEGEKLKTFKQGDAWYEPPGTIHEIARNGSKIEPARILVVYIGEEGKAATTPIK